MEYRVKLPSQFAVKKFGYWEYLTSTYANVPFNMQ